jgi:raffinose/stachyose/melibiose transport system permease protein
VGRRGVGRGPRPDLRVQRPVGLSTFQGSHFSNYAALAAGSCLAALPVVLVYLFAQRSFISGLFAGSLVE